MKIIIGASGGIGSKLFEYYRKSQDVIGTFLNNGEESEFMYGLDIANYVDVRNFVNTIDLYDGEICLINCAGVNRDAMAHKAHPVDWADVVETNLIGAFYITQAFLPFMRKHNHGRIINMGSVVAQKGVAGTSAYAASKAGLWGMTKAIAEENRDKNITINTLNLGYMEAGMGTRFDGTGDIQNVINAVNFLVESEFVTGTSIDINGGII